MSQRICFRGPYQPPSKTGPRVGWYPGTVYTVFNSYTFSPLWWFRSITSMRYPEARRSDSLEVYLSAIRDSSRFVAGPCFSRSRISRHCFDNRGASSGATLLLRESVGKSPPNSNSVTMDQYLHSFICCVHENRRFQTQPSVGVGQIIIYQHTCCLQAVQHCR